MEAEKSSEFRGLYEWYHATTWYYSVFFDIVGKVLYGTNAASSSPPMSVGPIQELKHGAGSD
jgi:hypothetical protein